VTVSKPFRLGLIALCLAAHQRIPSHAVSLHEPEGVQRSGAKSDKTRSARHSVKQPTGLGERYIKKEENFNPGVLQVGVQSYDGLAT